MTLQDVKSHMKKIFELIDRGDKERAAMNIKLENHLTAHKVKWNVIKAILWILGIIGGISAAIAAFIRVTS